MPHFTYKKLLNINNIYILSSWETISNNSFTAVANDDDETNNDEDSNNNDDDK